MLHWLKGLRGAGTTRREIPQRLWRETLERYAFLAPGDAQEQEQLRQLSTRFLASKEFHGADGLRISDEIAVAIAAQACLPVLRIEAPYRGLDWYADFVGIVVHPGAVLAQRETIDDDGIVHQYQEALTGEAMQDGPVTLSWQDVADAGQTAEQGYNVVIHEFVHKIDMRDGAPDGCPPLPPDFLGAASASAARRAWFDTMQSHYLAFCDQLSLAERFGATEPWLDPYAAQSIDEFFAVVSEAYFVNRPDFRRDFPGLLPMLDAFFKPRLPSA